MQKLVLLSIILMSFLMLFLVGCVNPDDPNDTEIETPTGWEDLNPGIAEWVVMLTAGLEKSTYVVSVTWIGGINIPQVSDTAVLYVNGNDVEIDAMIPGVWFGSCNVAQGSDATIKFVYNGETRVDTSLKTVNLITDATFPTTYNPTQTAAISWTLPTNNQHQVVGISASKDDAKEWSGDYSREVLVADRSFTFPANPIADAPAGADYTLGVTEVNFKIKNKIALMSVDGAFSDSYHYKADAMDMSLLARRMLKTLTR